MHKEIIEVYVCQYCGFKHMDEEYVKQHEENCIKNPINQPCGECENHIIGIGCARGVNMDSVGGNVMCFYYEKGQPKNLLTIGDEDYEND